MLTGKQVRVRVAGRKIVPRYLNVDDPQWSGVAAQLVEIYRHAEGRTRGEIEAEFAETFGNDPTQLVHQGLAKLLEDRCEYEVSATVTPEKVRESAFRLATLHRVEIADSGEVFDRDAVFQAVAEELGEPAELLKQALFADLRDEQRVLKFDDITAERLLHRYNVGLAQALLLRSTAMEVRIWDETPVRFRKLFRLLKFHQLIHTIRTAGGNSYILTIDGPLSLFSSTLKYGMQLANFLPGLLHCKAFDLKAEVLWGPKKTEKTFTLKSMEGLRSHTADFGVFVPPAIKNFTANFRDNIAGWTLSDDPHPIPVEGTTWVPDIQLQHGPTGKIVNVEFVGYWRKLDVESHYKKLQRALSGAFMLVISEQYKADDDNDLSLLDGIYRYKRTPIAAEVAKVAAHIAGV